MLVVNAAQWYWKVTGKDGVYSGATNTYVPETDPTYLGWLSFMEMNGVPVPTMQAEADIWYYVSNIRQAWLFNGTTFSQPSESTYTKVQLKNYAAMVRYAKETGGVTVNGIAIATDRVSQGLVDRAYAMAAKDSTFTTRWKSADGTFGPVLNAATVMAVGDAVGQHVAACFAKEADVCDQIDASSVASLVQIDQAFSSN